MACFGVNSWNPCGESRSAAQATEKPVAILDKTCGTWISETQAKADKVESLLKNGALSSELRPALEELSQVLLGEDGAPVKNAFRAAATHAGIPQWDTDTFLDNPETAARIAKQTQSAAASFNETAKKATDHITSQPEKWEKLGLEKAHFERVPDLAEGLLRSNVAYAVVGFQASTLHPENHGIRIDNGVPQLKVNGAWTSLDHLATLVKYNPEKESMVSVDDETKVWNYFSPHGLQQIDRRTYDQPYSVHELSAREYELVAAHGVKFYDGKENPDAGKDQKHFVQFFTTPRNQLGNTPLAHNANITFPTHIGTRVIVPKSEEEGSGATVYSFGLELPEDGVRELGFFNMGKTYTNAKVGMLDYEEFRKFDTGTRYTTTIPLTEERAQNIMNLIPGEKSFNFAHQNCAVFARDALHEAGHDVDLRRDGLAYVFGALPSLTDLPGVGPSFFTPIQKGIAAVSSFARRIFNAVSDVTPNPIKSALSCFGNALTFVPRKIHLFFKTVITNSLIILAGGRQSNAPANGTYEGTDNKERMTRFDRLFKSKKDIFRPHLAKVMDYRAFFEWQKKQATTLETEWNGKPIMTILPQRP